MDAPVVNSEANVHRSPASTAGGGGGAPASAAVIDLTSSGSSDSEPDPGGAQRSRRAVRARKRTRISSAVPAGFLDPLPPPPPPAAATRVIRQFWKAGDYDGKRLGEEAMQPSASGMDHVRVHPKFLHSNATSHKWALGALAELLDNSLDEVVNGATYVNIDMLENEKDKSRMLLVEDNGGGMDPDKMRQCMSLGYSAKSNVANTIGQYGNGFKTSTMRLGADVLVFTRSRGKEGRRPTQSIGMLSYTFLRSTCKEDIIVPMIDYEREQTWKRKVRTTLADWHTNLETIIKWSPYATEEELLQQFSLIKGEGTRVVIYNLWEDDQGELELDFDADVNDIQIRGVNRHEKNIQMAKQFPNSKHFLTYRHSLRSYASILYLRVPHIFRMILRGKEIEHHNIVNDMMLKQQVTYKPVLTDRLPKDSDVTAVVTIGFVKDAKHHIDVQGFNVYHKNRLIKPFWRVWTAAGSGGRGVIGVLEVNFIEPAHDKQDFERTTILSRLETRLVQMQKTYWLTNSHRIGYTGICGKINSGTGDRENSPEDTPCAEPLSYQSGKHCEKLNNSPKFQSADKSYPHSSRRSGKTSTLSLEKSKYGLRKRGKSYPTITMQQRAEKSARIKRMQSVGSVLHGFSSSSNDSDPEIAGTPSRSTPDILNTPPPKKSSRNESTSMPSPPSNAAKGSEKITNRSHLKEGNVTSNGYGRTVDDSETVIKLLKDENSSLKERISTMEESMSQELQIERDKNKSLTERLEDVQRQLETTSKEHEALINIFSEERKRGDQEEQNLRKKIKEASSTIQDLLKQLSAARNCHKV